MLALAAAAAAAVASTTPTIPTPAFAQDVKVKSGERHGERHGDSGRHEGFRHREVKKVVLHHDRGRHEGFSHSRHYGYGKKVVIKRGHGKTVIKKKFEG